MDSANHFEVVLKGDHVFILNIGMLLSKMTKRKACLLAAWLSIVADPDGTEVPKLIADIKKS